LLLNCILLFLFCLLEQIEVLFSGYEHYLLLLSIFIIFIVYFCHYLLLLSTLIHWKEELPNFNFMNMWLLHMYIKTAKTTHELHVPFYLIFDLCQLFYSNCLGSKGWRSGESARLPPMWPGFKSRRRRHMWVEFVVGSLLCSERFLSWYFWFSPLLKN